MSGEQLPQSTQRDIKLIERRLRDVELGLQALQVKSLDDLDDCQVLYDHPSLAPAEGNVLIWYPDPSVVPFGGLWKPGNPFGAQRRADRLEVLDEPDHDWVIPGLLQWSSGGYADHSTPLDIYDDLEPDGGWYVADISATADSLPSNMCGWQMFVQASSGSWFGSYGQADYGVRHGTWLGSTGDSGAYGWQPALSVLGTYPAPYASATAMLGVPSPGAEVYVQAACTVWTLDDPGTGPSHFGAPAATPSYVDTLINVSMIRIAPL